MALIYGQQHPQYSSHDRQYLGDGLSSVTGHHGIPTRAGYYIQSGSGVGGNGTYQSPYLMNMIGDGSLGRNSNATNIIRRRNYLDEYKNQNSGY